MAATKTPAQKVLSVVEEHPLVGVNRASALLGIASANFRRYRPRLTEVPVEGSAAVFVREEVEELAAELRSEREARSAAGAAG
jgi:hypothetical protein